MASCKAANYSYRSTRSFIKRIMTWLRHRKSARLLRKKSNDDDDNFRRILIEHYCYYYYGSIKHLDAQVVSTMVGQREP